MLPNSRPDARCRIAGATSRAFTLAQLAQFERAHAQVGPDQLRRTRARKPIRASASPPSSRPGGTASAYSGPGWSRISAAIVCCSRLRAFGIVEVADAGRRSARPPGTTAARTTSVRRATSSTSASGLHRRHLDGEKVLVERLPPPGRKFRGDDDEEHGRRERHRHAPAPAPAHEQQDHDQRAAQHFERHEIAKDPVHQSPTRRTMRRRTRRRSARHAGLCIAARRPRRRTKASASATSASTYSSAGRASRNSGSET